MKSTIIFFSALKNLLIFLYCLLSRICGFDNVPTLPKAKITALTCHPIISGTCSGGCQWCGAEGLEGLADRGLPCDFTN